MAVSLSYLTNSATGVSVTTSYTFSSVTFGAAATDRLLVVCISTDNGNGATDSRASSVTIGGISAVKIAEGQYSSGSTRASSEIWAAYVPTGTTGNVVVNTTGNAVGCGIALYRLTGARITTTQTPIQLAEGDGSQTGSITVSTGGVAIGCSNYGGSNLGSNNITWTNLTEDAEHQHVNAGRRAGYASTTSTGSISVTSACSGTISYGGTLAVAAFDPMPTLTADVGAFTLTGVAATLQKSVVMPADVGAFTLSGIAAGLSRTWLVQAETGVFTLSGVSANLLKGFYLGAGVGSFTLSGIANNLFYHRLLTAETGVFTPKPRTNYFRQSQTFQTTWSKTRSSITADATTAPDGTTTADKLVEDTTASNSHYMFQSPPVSFFTAGKYYVNSIYAKAAERTRIAIEFPSACFGGSSSANRAFFDLTNGVVDLTGANVVAAGIEPAGDGWYRCWSAELCTVTGTTSNRTLFAISASSPGVNSYSYTGDGVSGVYFWGAQHEEDLTAPTAYIPTTTAAVTAYTEFANLRYDRRLVSDAGAFTLNGQDAVLNKTYLPLTAGVGVFSLTGQDAILKATRTMPADTGAFTFTGVSAGLYYNPALFADTGVFTLTGVNANLLKFFRLYADRGVFTLSGVDVELRPWQYTDQDLSLSDPYTDVTASPATDFYTDVNPTVGDFYTDRT